MSSLTHLVALERLTDLCRVAQRRLPQAHRGAAQRTRARESEHRRGLRHP